MILHKMCMPTLSYSNIIIYLFSVMKVKEGLGGFENANPWKLWVLSTVSKSLDTKEYVELGLFVYSSQRDGNDHILNIFSSLN